MSIFDRNKREMRKTSVTGDGVSPSSSSSEPHKRLKTGAGDINRERYATGGGGQITTTSNNANPFSVMLADPSLLSCCICQKPLTIPVFQCTGGHMACSGCIFKFNLKCPSCSDQTPKGITRNLAIETLLQSIKISCSYEIYGCKEKISYCNKSEHENACVFGPYPCPFTPCTFSGSPKGLYLHLKNQHTDSVVALTFHEVCTFAVSRNKSVVVLLGEEKDASIFVINMKSRRMEIGCIQEPTLSKGRGYGYSLSAGDKFGSFSYQSRTNSLGSDYLAKEKAAEEALSLNNFVSALHYFFPNDEYVAIDLSVCKQGCTCKYCQMY